jgi:hypothetical protein
MKMTVSVPDALWNRVRRPGEGASSVVQRGLTALDATSPSNEPSPETVAATAPDLEGIASRLAAEAEHYKDLGYHAGIRAAAHLSWSALSDLVERRAPLLRVAEGNWDSDNRDDESNVGPPPEALDTTNYRSVIVAIEEVVAEFGRPTSFFPDIYEGALTPQFEIGFRRALRDVHHHATEPKKSTPAAEGDKVGR